MSSLSCSTWNDRYAKILFLLLI